MTGDADLREFSGYTIKRAMAVIGADINRALTAHNLRMVTWSVLSVIATKQALKQAELADILAIERPNLVQIIDDLVKRGLIAKTRDPCDRRAYQLALTDQGRAVHADALKDVKQHEARMTKGLTETDRAELKRLLSVIEMNGSKHNG